MLLSTPAFTQEVSRGQHKLGRGSAHSGFGLKLGLDYTQIDAYISDNRANLLDFVMSLKQKINVTYMPFRSSGWLYAILSPTGCYAHVIVIS